MQYTQKVMEQFKNNKNYGKIDNADAYGKAGSAQCGDTMDIYLKIDNGIITDAKFETYGCVAAIASSSMAIDMVKNKSVQEALKITNREVIDELGGLPEEKEHCSVLAEDAIRNALEEYIKKNK